ncbi:universal stress protein [Nitrospira sp. Kam-Ns4a]
MKALAQRVLLATDCSEASASAELYALGLAIACGAALEVVHVLELLPGLDPEYPVNRLYLEELRSRAAPRLGELIAQAKAAGVSAVGHELVGDPSERILARAREAGTDLIVLGTHGRTGLGRVLVGSTAARLVAQAPCPVLTVRLAHGRPQAHGGRQEPGRTAAEAAPDRLAIRRILTPVDFSDCSLEALEQAILAAKQFDAALTILHVVEPVAYGLDFTLGGAAEGQALRLRWEAKLAELAAVVTAQGLAADWALASGVPGDTILARARDRACDLIVMGTHGRRGLRHLVAGSVAEAVLRAADCPVMTVKSPKFERERARS